MSAVQQVIGRLLSDRGFRAQVQSDGEAALREYSLTVHELTVLTGLDLEQWNTSEEYAPSSRPDVTISVYRV